MKSRRNKQTIGAPGISITFAAAILLTTFQSRAQQDLPDTIRKLDPHVLPNDEASKKKHRYLLHNAARHGLAVANKRSSEAWYKIKTRDDWEKFRDQKIEALRTAVGRPTDFPHLPTPQERIKALVPLRMLGSITGTLKGDGYKLHKVVYSKFPGHVITAHLYAPDPLRDSMPGIIISHSHHNPKQQGELQDMGMIWARAGCYVLTPDHLGHGERRQHPFASPKDYPKSFRTSRQDYYFRYNVGIQLHLIGSSLIGWLSDDLSRGVDLLLQQENIDPQRIIMLGAVAGGGDPCGVTGALDKRIAAVIPFNFGGPQPESRYPLPDDIEKSFGYAGSGSWESTRNMTHVAGDGFLPWVIVGSVAPRRLIHAHEFSWDQKRDPVWKRYQNIFSFYQKPDHLDYTHGYGLLRESSGKASHCNNIGVPHRKRIHEALKKWFGIPIADESFRDRRDSSTLICMTPQVAKQMRMQPVHKLASRIASIRKQYQRQVAPMNPPKRRSMMRDAWSKKLGLKEIPEYASEGEARIEKVAGIEVERYALRTEPGLILPIMLLRPAASDQQNKPKSTVIMIAQGGKRKFLAERADAIATFLKGGTMVCLPDLRGTGETRPENHRGRRSWDTSISATQLMLSQPMLGRRLADLRAIIEQLRQKNTEQIALWGDSFAPVNDSDTVVGRPLEHSQPPHSEPLGGLLALLGALYEDDVKAVYVRRGLVGYRSVLNDYFVHIPHDVVLQGALANGDLDDVAALLAPRPLRLEGLVDAVNRPVSARQLTDDYQVTEDAYLETGPGAKLQLSADVTDPAKVAEWIIKQLK